MALQTDVSGSAQNLNIEPKFVYCPKAHESAALTATNSEYECDGTSVNSTLPNNERNRSDVVSDSRLDANSTDKWYALGDPYRYDTVEVTLLGGRDEPTIVRTDMYDVLGVNWTVWIDCVVQALDFRAMTINDGA